jgi:hypothetical protein
MPNKTVDTLDFVVRNDPPTDPPPGVVRVWVDTEGRFHAINNESNLGFALVGGAGEAETSLSLRAGRAIMDVLNGATVLLNGEEVFLGARDLSLSLTPTGGALSVSGVPFRLIGLPTTDPHVAGALWIDQSTNLTMVSAG